MKKTRHQTALQAGVSGEHEELSHAVTYRVSQFAGKMNAHATRLLRKHAGLSLVQWRILFLLDLFETAYASDLSKRAGMDAGLFSRNLRGLVEAGFVKSTADPADQRQSCLRLTARGKKAFERAAPLMMERRELLFSGISENDKKIFFKVLDQLDRNVLALSDSQS